MDHKKATAFGQQLANNANMLGSNEQGIEVHET